MKLRNAYKNAKHGAQLYDPRTMEGHIVGMGNGGKKLQYIPPTQGRVYSDNARVVTPDTTPTERETQIALSKRRGSISQGKIKTAYEKAKDATSFVEREKQRTGSASPISYVLDTVNPAAVAFSAADLVKNTGSAIKNTAQGNFRDAGSDLLQAGVNALGVLPAASQLRGIAKPLSKFARLSPSQYKSVQQFANNPLNKTGELLNDKYVYGTPRKLKSLEDVKKEFPLYRQDLKDRPDLHSEFFNKLGSESDLLDNSIKRRVGDLESLEGKKRLVNQEKNYLLSKGEDPLVADRVSKLNAQARIDELKNINNVNKQVKGLGDSTKRKNINGNDSFEKDILNNESLYNNAYYNVSVDDQLKNMMSQKSKSKNSLFSTEINYAKPSPGEIAIGYNYRGSTPVHMHEIAHALQRNRKLPLDTDLQNRIVPKKYLSNEQNNAYNYFMQGSEGMEPTAFANELRESMLKKGIIKNTYDPISYETIAKAHKHFQENPMGFSNPETNSFLSNTRILDFMEPTKNNFSNLASLMNKLPAAAPVGVGIAAGASQLNKKPGMKNGGKVDHSNDDDMVNGVASILRRVKDKKNRLQLANQMSNQFKREKVKYSLNDFLNKSKVKK